MGLPALIDPGTYLQERREFLNEQLALVDQLATADELPEASITALGLKTLGLKTAPLETIVPEAAKALINQVSGMLPRIPITSLLLKVDSKTGFTNDFPYLKSGAQAKDKTLLLTAILADGINLGLTKMLHIQSMHVRDETHSAAPAMFVNAQNQHP
ncbi:Tn3 family transposase [Specibacter sp. NPDC057265]|uniref:Tn3 family transposase n=1 Tax=Specibacter sp. NPDC057265 TaxID=3346075 RepID=UPI003636080B